MINNNGAMPITLQDNGQIIIVMTIFTFFAKLSAKSCKDQLLKHNRC